MIKDLNTPREFPRIGSASEWTARAKSIREHILVSCGLWPMPEKTPLKANIFGKIDRDGYSIEKVYFQTMPGFYLAGNLYRPLGRGKSPFPGVLNPHGHWKEGRLVDSKDGSVVARCVSFARQGMVAFSYDMVGFNDTHFADAPTEQPDYDVHRQFGAGKTDQVWNISLMGLQTWNSVRALDFLESLPDVDKQRLACTGESGGGTQTFMLGAVDDRLAVQAPVVMVSHTMQGGCSCENAPGLRVEYSNMEFAAVPAPRSQILVAATGDWTKATLSFEGPAIASIYRLFNARDHFDFVRFDFGHNYNQTSREAVYAWFGKWLLAQADPSSCKENSYQKEPDSDLRVFPDGHLPRDAMTREQFTESLKKLHQAQWQAMVPKNKDGLEKFKQVMLPAWRHTLQVESSRIGGELIQAGPKRIGDFDRMIFSSDKTGDLGIVSWTPRNLRKQPSKLVVLSLPDRPTISMDGDAPPVGLSLLLLQKQIPLMEVTRVSGGEPPDQFTNFYTTYNRTRLQQLVGDLVGICKMFRIPQCQIVLVGIGANGLPALLAAPGADAVVADANSVDISDDQTLLATDLFCPGLRNLGVFEGPALLAAPNPLLVHHTGEHFPTNDLRSGYKAAGAAKHLRIESTLMADEALAKYITGL